MFIKPNCYNILIVECIMNVVITFIILIVEYIMNVVWMVRAYLDCVKIKSQGLNWIEYKIIKVFIYLSI